MPVLNPPDPWLLSAQAANGTGSARDTRHALNAAYLTYFASGNSAIFNLEASHNSTGWMVVATYTATGGNFTGTAQIDGYFPYVRANATSVYSAAGGSAQLWVNYQPIV